VHSSEFVHVTCYAALPYLADSKVGRSFRESKFSSGIHGDAGHATAWLCSLPGRMRLQQGMNGKNDLARVDLCHV